MFYILLLSWKKIPSSGGLEGYLFWPFREFWTPWSRIPLETECLALLMMVWPSRFFLPRRGVSHGLGWRPESPLLETSAQDARTNGLICSFSGNWVSTVRKFFPTHESTAGSLSWKNWGWKVISNDSDPICMALSHNSEYLLTYHFLWDIIWPPSQPHNLLRPPPSILLMCSSHDDASCSFSAPSSVIGQQPQMLLSASVTVVKKTTHLPHVALSQPIIEYIKKTWGS